MTHEARSLPLGVIYMTTDGPGSNRKEVWMEACPENPIWAYQPFGLTCLIFHLPGK